MSQDRIDRRALVMRHNPVITRFEPLSPLSVGNGEFAFTADFTGLQSFPQYYRTPLGTQSQWGWHSSRSKSQYSLNDIQLHMYDTGDRQVGYAVSDSGQEEPFHWLRQNPHRLQLGQIGLRLLSEDGKEVGFEDISGKEQTLDMWTGILTSRFQVNGVPVFVQTCCHPLVDELGVRIVSPLVNLHRLEITFGFPSPHPTSKVWGETIELNWQVDEEQSHKTDYRAESNQSGVFIRTLDEDGYRVSATWFMDGEVVQDESHRYRLVPQTEGSTVELSIGFHSTQALAALPAFDDIAAASAEHWERFWNEGGAVELVASRDPRAAELERRILLSQFLTAIHCSGSLPPQETGLLYNSWFGKFHLEMHWWHAVHFALWGRTYLLRKSMDWYIRILPVAKQIAHSQGYEGARWPKMVGPNGQESPSPIGPLLIWQQPHPIVYAELCYLAEPKKETLEAFRDIVLETAAFMASFATWDAERERYVLGPPVIPAQEEHKPEKTWNPTFELEYWRHGLELAQLWRQRLGLPTEPQWHHICERISALPVAGGVYVAHENDAETFTRVNKDHPSMLGALGILPGKSVDPEVMRNTLFKVLGEWQWDTSWGWDFPMTAMTAARLGEGEAAVSALLMNATKNTYLPNGHNYQHEELTAYLPGNGGLLAAVAIMASGFQGGPRDIKAPGFPQDGSWTVRFEGLNAWL